MSKQEDIDVIKKAFSKIDGLYIADGHHRSASSTLLCDDLKKENKNHTGQESYNYFMSFLIAEEELKIHEFNRLIKDLNGLSKETFLIKLDELFRIENRGQMPYKPTKKHHFSMYLDGEFYSLYLREMDANFKTSLDSLDAQILYKTILNPILGIKDLRKDTRISYSSGKKDFIYSKSVVDTGEFKVAFGMLPATIDQIKNIADEGLTMPPKSTYIEPKLRSGVAIYEF